MIGLLALLAASTATPASITAALAGRSECVPFRWAPGPTSPKGAIIVPVTLNGRRYDFQLDTGADATILYGRAAIENGWASAGAETFRARSLSIGSTQVDRPKVYVEAGTGVGDGPAGTLGLPELVGKVAVIDYPGMTFCAFADADLPAALRTVGYAPATLRNGKLFVTMSSGAFKSDAMVFDTGSSELPVNVDLGPWKAITGVPDPERATTHYGSKAWGKPFRLDGAPAADTVTVETRPAGKPIVFTDPTHPDAFARWPFRSDGLIGNALFLSGTVVLDLTARVRFGFVG